MRFLDRFQRKKKPASKKEKLDPKTAAMLARLEASDRRREAFYKEQGIVSQLHDHESAFAVIMLTKTASPQALRQMAQRLQEWASQTKAVTRILGLEHMLQGERPQVATSLLMIPMSDDPDTWVSSIALVVVREDSGIKDLPERLSHLLANHPEVSIFSAAQYSFMTR